MSRSGCWSSASDARPRLPRRRLGRARPRDADPAAPSTVPLTTPHRDPPGDLGDLDPAATWLAELRADEARSRPRSRPRWRWSTSRVHAHRAATLDPAIADVATDAALALRVGFGTGDELAEGDTSARSSVPGAERRRRAEVLRPQERVAEVLGGRGAIAACELLLIRARADLDAGRAARGGAAAARGARRPAGRTAAALAGAGTQGARGLRRAGRGAASVTALAPERAEPADLELEATTLGLAEVEAALRIARSARPSRAQATRPGARRRGAGSALATPYSAARTAVELVDDVAVELQRGLAVVRGRALGDDRDPAAGGERELGQAGDRVDLERGADAEQQVGAGAQALRPRPSPPRAAARRRARRRASPCPCSTAQVATPSASNSSPTFSSG